MATSTDVSTAKRGADVVLSSDTTGLSGVRALYVGVTGDVKVDLADGGVGLTFKAHPVGYMLAQVTKVYSTANGTTATNLILLF
jgi:hypothetical protein